MSTLLQRGAVGVALGVLVLVYGCDAGHGFVKDDFTWIAQSRLEGPHDIGRLVAPAAAGFFRPIVSLTFAIDHALFGLDPLGYGMTNLALLLAAVGLLFLLLKALGLHSGAAAGGALVWALNFHAVNMAVLWISGRTALVLVVWSVAAAWAWVRGHRLAAAALTMLAMWSKEEGFALPAILAAWSFIESRDSALPLWRRIRRTMAETWGLWAVAVVSLGVRAWSGAWTPASAPSFYQYRFDLSTLLTNAYQYADRSATTPVLVLLLFWLVAGRPRLADSRAVGRRGLKGAVWLVAGFAPTLLLPVRSSLYALFPSIGLIIVLSDLADRMAPRVSRQALNRAVAFLVVLLVGLIPVYKARNRRYVREAELSATVMREVSSIARERTRTVVLIQDARDVRPTAEQAFGGLAEEAGSLMTAGRVRLWIEPPPGDLVGRAPPEPAEIDAVLVVANGQVTRAR